MNNIQLVPLLIVFGGFFALVLAFGQISQRQDTPYRFFAMINYLIIFIWQTWGGLRFMKIDLFDNFNEYCIMVPLFYATIPLLYFYFRSILDLQFKFRLYHLINFFPVLVFLIVLSPFDALNYHLYPVMNIGNAKNWSGADILFTFSNYFSQGIALVYLIHLLVIIIRIFRANNSVNRKIAGLSIKIILFVTLVILTWFFDRTLTLGLEQYIYLSFTFILIGIFILHSRYPEFLLQLNSEIINASIAATETKDQLNFDYTVIAGKIEKIMNDDQIYRDETVGLKELSDIINESPHHISAVINHLYNRNFYNFMNDYRITEACKLLIEAPEQTVISIAMNIGFNSTSAFYNAFKDRVGMSPVKFRKTNCAN